MATIPYPPAPELGWYADDPVDKPAAVSSAAAEPSPISSSTASHAAKGSSDGDIEDWDSTVLSSSFTAKAPRKIYILHNDATGQTIVIDKSTLLGRKPSMDVPEGAKAEKGRGSDAYHIAQSCRDQHRSERHAVDRGLRFPQRHLHHPRRAGSAGAQGQAARTRRPRHAAYRRPVLPTHRAPVAALHYPSCEIPSGESPIQRWKTGL